MLIRHGKVDRKAMKQETLTELELKSVLHKQGVNAFHEVEKCVLEPNGTFYIEQVPITGADHQRAALMKAMESLTKEVKEMRAQLAAR